MLMQACACQSCAKVLAHRKTSRSFSCLQESALSSAMAFQCSAAPTQWDDTFESDAEGEAAMRAMEPMGSASLSMCNRDAAAAVPWQPVLSGSAASQSQHVQVQARAAPVVGPWPPVLTLPTRAKSTPAHTRLPSNMMGPPGRPLPLLSFGATGQGSKEPVCPLGQVSPAQLSLPSADMPSQAPCRTRPLQQMAMPSGLDTFAASSQPTAPPAPKRFRLRSKTPPPVSAAASKMDAKDHIFSQTAATVLGLTKENPEAKRMVYLITFPHTFRPDLVAPETLSRDAILCKVGDSMANPVYTHRCHEAQANPPEPNKMVCGRESHSELGVDGQVHEHDHVGLLATIAFRFMPVKRALLERHGLASHWSCTHDGYHSVVRYIVLPSPKKPEVALDQTPATWCRNGSHPPLLDEANEPNNVVAFRARRERKVKAAAAAGKADPRAGELDLYHIIVEQGFRNTPDDRHAHKRLIRYLRSSGSTAVFEWAFRNRHRLPALIDDVWAWENIDEAISRVEGTRVEQLLLASRRPCVCAGLWPQTAYTVLTQNGIDVDLFWHSFYMSLHDGRREDKTVMVLVGRRGGEGKSFLFSPLTSVFGVEFVQCTLQSGNYPLMNLSEKRVVLLNEWRFDDSVLDMATQLLWFEGKPLTITMPQNQGIAGHQTYEGTAPIFITTKEEYLRELVQSAQWAEAHDESSEATMLLRRLSLIHFTRKLPIAKGVHIPCCAACFSNMCMRHAEAFQLRSGM